MQLYLQAPIFSFCHSEQWITAEPNDCAFYGLRLRLLACWDCGFECRRGHGCLSLVIVVCCQVEVSASG
jgi:hypothetical protein